MNFMEIDAMGAHNSRSEYSKYHLFSKGGPNRRYFGNNEFVIRLNDLWNPSKTNVSVRRGDKEYYFKMAIGWSQVGNSHKSFRYVENAVCGTATPTIYLNDNLDFSYLVAFLNSKVAFSLLNIFNQTMNLLSTDVCSVPVVFNKEYYDLVHNLTHDAIEISKIDWDSFETSWDFKKHTLLNFPSNTIASSYDQWERFTENQFNQLKENEEELNRIFIEIYGLQDELTPDVAAEDVTVRKANVERDIKSFISYAVGCMFGRYSLDEEGLVYAGGEFESSKLQINCCR